MIEAMQHLSFIYEPHNIFTTLLITVTFVPAYCGVIGKFIVPPCMIYCNLSDNYCFSYIMYMLSITIIM